MALESEQRNHKAASPSVDMLFASIPLASPPWPVP